MFNLSLNKKDSILVLKMNYTMYFNRKRAVHSLGDVEQLFDYWGGDWTVIGSHLQHLSPSVPLGQTSHHSHHQNGRILLSPLNINQFIYCFNDKLVPKIWKKSKTSHAWWLVCLCCSRPTTQNLNLSSFIIDLLSVSSLLQILN